MNNIDEINMQRVQSILFPIIKQSDITNKKLWKEIKDLFMLSFANAGLNYFAQNIFWWLLVALLRGGVLSNKSIIQIENTIRKFVRKLVNFEKIRLPNAIVRSKHNFNIISDYIIGDTILDLGAGDGLLAKQIKEKLHKECILVDVVDYNYTDLPMIIYPEGKEIPLADKSVDCTILYVVLHHSDNPETVIKQAARITKKRIIVVEGYAEDKDIVLKNAFIDWFYNRVIRDCDINIPLNYKTEQQWARLFQNVGFKMIKSADIGIDEKLSPEHHILLVLEAA